MGMPLTVYGEGGQTRGFISLKDSIGAVEMCIANPPDKGEFRIVNQLTEVLTVNDIAAIVSKETGATVNHLENPRLEKEKHEYNVTFQKLKDWGLTEYHSMENEIRFMISDAKRYKMRIREKVIQPRTQWRAPVLELQEKAG